MKLSMFKISQTFICYLILLLGVLILNFGCRQTEKINKNFSKNQLILSSESKDWQSAFLQKVENHIKYAELRDTLFILFKEGTYQINEPFIFTDDTLRRRNAPIVIKGENNTHFSGGITLDNAAIVTLEDASVSNRIIAKKAVNNILEYDLFKAGIDNLGEIKSVGFGRGREAAPPSLYIDGERMPLARYPNAENPMLLKNRNTVMPIKQIINPGQERVELPSGANPKDSSLIEPGEFVYEDDRVEKWLNASEIWLDGIFTRDWSWSYNKVKEIDTVNKTIKLAYKEKYDLTAEHSFFFATNLLEEIDAPGEYFIDREKGKLYFYPPDDFDRSSSAIKLSSNTETFLHFEGIENLRIENIEFELGRFNAVKIDQCSNIKITDCSFHNFGNSAIIAKGENIKIEQCNIQSIGGTAIELNGGDFELLKSSDNEVLNCEISDWGNYHRVYSSAVALHGVGSRVIGNKMYFSPHGAITISGNTHLIEKNEISNVLLEFEDFGAIHSPLGKNQLMRGQIIRQNYFHDIGQIGERVFAIYVDEATSGWTIENNLFYKLGNPGARVGAIMGNTCSYVSIKNNLFLDCSQTFELSFHFATWGRVRYDEYFKKIWDKQFSNAENIPAVYLDNYPELKNFLIEDRIYVNTNSFTNNIIGNFSIPLKHEGFFYTRSDLENADSLLISSGNRYTQNEALVSFLKKWNSSSGRIELKNDIPALLKPYLENL